MPNMDFLLVGLGGIFGSLCRYTLGDYISKHSSRKFPFGTFLINVTGAFLLGMVSKYQSTSNTYLLLGDGFLGAYTTFSTFMYEGFNLFKGNKILNAVTYILSSLLLGIAAFYVSYKFT